MTTRSARIKTSARDASPAPAGPILFGTDGSAGSDLAARAVAQLDRALHAGVHVVHGWAPVARAYAGMGYLPVGMVETYLQPAESLLKTEVAALKRRETAILETHLVEGRVADLVPELATQIGARLIVIGSRGLGTIKRLVLGSVSEGIVHSANTPVLVVRGPRRSWPPKDIIVGVDGSTDSRRAALLGATLAKALGAHLRLVHVLPQAWQDASAPGQARVLVAATVAAQATLDELSSEILRIESIRPATSVFTGDPATMLVALARETPRSAMLVVGSRGIGAIHRLALGSVSMNVLRAAPASVLIVPHSSRVSAHLPSPVDADLNRLAS